MSAENKSHTIKAGDTLESISRTYYGTGEEQDRIKSANPAITDPLTVGATLFIPAIDIAHGIPERVAADSATELVVTIEGEEFRHFENMELNFSLDGFSAFGFTAPMEASNQAFRDFFRPMSYAHIHVFAGGVKVINGTMLEPLPEIGERREVSVSGYGVPAVLEDCGFPASSFPIEYRGLNLRDIAIQAAAPFGIGVDFRGDPGAIFDFLAATPDDQVFSFLVKLAQQRKYVISDTPDGNLLFWQSDPEAEVVAVFEEGQPPLMDVTPTYDPQEFYSHITGFTATIAGLPAQKYTVKNPFLLNVLRPFNYSIDDTVVGDIRQAVENKAGLMFAKCVSYEVTVPTWLDANGDLWETNKRVTLLAPNAMVYNKTELLVRNVTLSKTSGELTATLKLVLPGVFSGQLPEVLPWQDV